MALYALLPLPWVLWRPDGLFYSFDVAYLPRILIAYVAFGIAWTVGERLRPVGGWFEVPESGKDHAWPLATLAIVAALTCSLVANLVLGSMGALTIDEATGRVRVPVLTTLGNAHIFALIYSGCIVFLRRRTSVTMGVLAGISVLATIALGLLENRRTAVLLPLVVYLVLAVVARRWRLLRWVALTAPLFVGLFAFTTYDRTVAGSTVEFDEDVAVIAGDAVVGRLGNPLLILDPVLDHIDTDPAGFDPQTVRAVLAALPTFGLIRAPFDNGFGNALGHELGLLQEDNDYTGINSGWIGELLLFGGLTAVAVGGLVLGGLASTGWHLLSASHPAGIFLRVMVVIFVISGFQMEVALPIVSLLRAIAIAVLLAIAERTLANARIPP